MSSVRKFLFWILTIAGLVILQIIWNSYLPHPFNHCQIIFAGLTIYLLFTDNKKKFFWTLFITYWLFELLSSAPYGINLISILISFIILHQLSARLLTNHSARTAILLSAFGIATFRLIYALISVSTGFINIIQLEWGGILLLEFLWEIALTTAMAGILFFTAVFGARRFNPRYVLMDNRIFYG